MKNLIGNDSINEEENSGEYEKAGKKDWKWKLNFEKEIQFWNKIVLQDLLYKSDICPKCHKYSYKI